MLFPTLFTRCEIWKHKNEHYIKLPAAYPFLSAMIFFFYKKKLKLTNSPRSCIVDCSVKPVLSEKLNNEDRTKDNETAVPAASEKMAGKKNRRDGKRRIREKHRETSWRTHSRRVRQHVKNNNNTDKIICLLQNFVLGFFFTWKKQWCRKKYSTLWHYNTRARVSLTL